MHIGQSKGVITVLHCCTTDWYYYQSDS